jgi:hypothetical protein
LRQRVHLQLQLQLPIARNELLHLELLQLQLPIARNEPLQLELQL